MRQLHDKLWVHEDSMKLAGVNLPLRMTPCSPRGRRALGTLTD